MMTGAISHRIRYCRCYPVGHRIAGKCHLFTSPGSGSRGDFGVLRPASTGTGTIERPLIIRSISNYSVRCVLRSLIKHSHGPAVLRPARIVVAYRNWPFLPIRDRAHAFI